VPSHSLFQIQVIINSSSSKQPKIIFPLILGVWIPCNDDLGEHPCTQFGFPKGFYLDLRNLITCTYLAVKTIPYDHGPVAKKKNRYVNTTQVIQTYEL